LILIRNIKNYHPANFLLFVTIGILVWLKTFISKDAVGIYFDSDPMPIYNWIYNGLNGASLSLLCKFIAFIIVLLQAIIINGITNQYNLLGFRSYLPGIFFLLITAILPEYQLLHPILFANLFLLIAWERITSISEKSNAFRAFFNAAFFLGLSTLFYPNYIYFFAIIVIAALLNRISHAREFIMIILGFITVWYFYFSLNYIFYSELQLRGTELGLGILSANFEKLDTSQIIFFIYLAFLLLLASFQLSTYISNVKIQIRRNLKLLFIWFMISLSMFIFTKSSLELVYSIAIPISFLFAMFFTNIKNKWLVEIIWVLIIGLTVVNLFFPQLL